VVVLGATAALTLASRGQAAEPEAAPAEATVVAVQPDEEPCPEGCMPAAPSQRATEGFGVGIGITQLQEVDSVNARLKRVGYGELAGFGAGLSFSIPMSIDRLMILAQIRMTSVGSEDDLSTLDTYLGTFSMGYSITPPEVLAVYPFVGLGIGSAELSLGRPAPLVATFDEAVRGTVGPVDISTIAMVGTVGIGADLLIASTVDHPSRGLFLGVRAGHVATFFNAEWSLGADVGDVEDGPLAPLSGFYGEFNFGLRF
jgi:hypothetical protein